MCLEEVCSICTYVCGFGCGDAFGCVYGFGSQRLEADVFSFNPRLIFLLCSYTWAMTHV